MGAAQGSYCASPEGGLNTYPRNVPKSHRLTQPTTLPPPSAEPIAACQGRRGWQAGHAGWERMTGLLGGGWPLLAVMQVLR